MTLRLEPFEATLLFIVVSLWFLSLVSNELRQFFLAKKNKDARESYFTTTISGNMVDLMSYLLFFIGFILHLISIYVYGDNYPQGPLVIIPEFNDDDFNLYCPFHLPTCLVITQAYFQNLFTMNNFNEINVIYWTHLKILKTFEVVLWIRTDIIWTN